MTLVALPSSADNQDGPLIAELPRLHARRRIARAADRCPHAAVPQDHPASVAGRGLAEPLLTPVGPPVQAIVDGTVDAGATPGWEGPGCV